MEGADTPRLALGADPIADSGRLIKTRGAPFAALDSRGSVNHNKFREV
jgi:hypothetical protein